MKFWIIHEQEPLPEASDRLRERPWRSDAISGYLADRGHEVTRWRSNYSHREKRYLVRGTPTVQHDNYRIQYLRGRAYRRHIGIKRIVHHASLAQSFQRLAESQPLPDLVHVSNVPLELCSAAIRFAKQRSIPVVIDVRDLWPDLFLDLLPERLTALKPIARLLLWRQYNQAQFAMRNATAVTGITRHFVDWGLRLGDRAGTKADRVFHMSYSRNPPIDRGAIEAAIKQLIGDENNEFLVCYFGNIGYQSDFTTVINAARLMKDSNAKFVICGDGPRLDDVRRQATDLKNVVVTGWVSASTIRDLLSLATVGLLPFIERDNFVLNMPNKFAEYLSGGLVLACGLKGEMASQIVKHRCGFVYRFGAATELATELKRLIGDRTAIQEMRERSLKLFNEEFDADKVLAEMGVYLEEMALTAVRTRTAEA